MELALNVPNAPVFEITNTEMLIHLNLDIGFEVEEHHGKTSTAFKGQNELVIAFALAAKAVDHDKELEFTPNLSTSGTKFIQIKVSDSQIGKIDLTALEGLLNNGVDLVAQLVNNYVMEHGGLKIKLPKWLKLSNVHIHNRSGVLEIDASPKPQDKVV